MSPNIRKVMRLLEKNNQLLWDMRYRQRKQIRELKNELKLIKRLITPGEISRFKSRIVRFK